MKKISYRNYLRLQWIYHFCNLYIAYRDFDLNKKIAKNEKLDWNQAESLSNFFNQLVFIKKSKPEDFIHNDDDSANNAIDSYINLKKCLLEIKKHIGTKEKNQLYKAVKLFYRKRTFCYQMDFFYTFLIFGYWNYVNNVISIDNFMKNHIFEVSLFDGRKKMIEIRQVIKISKYILSFQDRL